jgi:SAM-dependent methyltransferase
LRGDALKVNSGDRPICITQAEKQVESGHGQCNICGWVGAFLKPEGEREGMVCGNCSATSRHRAIAYVAGRVLGRGDAPVFAWEANKSIRVLESSARGSYPVMFADKFDYYAVEFDPAKIAEGTHPREYADFQKLHYADATFDLVIASDVFEHVRKDDEGYREILRTLKPGGSFIMTVPYDHHREKTIVRVDTSGSEDKHLLEPEYHGGGGHTLTYRNYGRDLLTLLKRTGFSVGHIDLHVAAHAITRQSVIVGSKADYVELSGSPPQTDQESLGLLLPYRLFLLVKYNLRGFVHYWKEMKRG